MKNSSLIHLLRSNATRVAVLLIVLAGLAAGTSSWWLPWIQREYASRLSAGSPVNQENIQHDEESGAHDDHEHAVAADKADNHEENIIYDHQHSDAEAIILGAQAQKNIGVRLTKVALGQFERTINVPGMVVERPGWTTLEVTAPMTGAVTRIYAIQGEAVCPGQSLFEVRLTHEDLLQQQTEFLRIVEELDVISSELARLEKVASEGAIAGKTLLERKYEQQKQQAAQRAQRQALLLHGLTKEQIDDIEKNRTLLPSLAISAPTRENGTDCEENKNIFQVQELKVSQGTHVTAGATLCRLADLAQLYIEGKAFEQDVEDVNAVQNKGAKVAVILGANTGPGAETVQNLKILYLDDRVDPESRTFRFYITLPNQIVRKDTDADGRRFLYWKFKPGQRVQIKVPVETWTDRIVLPLEAVAQDGADFYVFEFNGDHFDRRAVHVEYRDQNAAVIADDGALKPGVMVAESAAHQMQLAMKNKAGGTPDPHAGHNH